MKDHRWLLAWGLRAGGRAVLVIGLLAIVVGTLMLSQATKELVGFDSATPQPGLLLGLSAFVGGAVVAALVGIVGARMHRRGRQLAAAVAARPTPGGPFVLYLRPFAADIALAAIEEGLQNMGPWLTYEEQLREAFRTVGPMVAIGRPGEPLPTVGAIRTEAHEQWQRTVLNLLDRARLVIIVLGGSEGVRWEIERAVERVRPDRLLVLTLGGDSWYAAARSHLGRSFPRGLPPYPASGARARRTPITGAVWFHPDWTPVLVRLDIARGNASHWFESVCVYELKPVFTAMGADWPGPRSRYLQRSRATARGLRTTLSGGCLAMMSFLLAIGLLAYLIDL